MIRAVDMLIDENRVISGISSLALLLFIAALALIGYAEVMGIDQAKNTHSLLSSVIGLSLLGVLVLGMFTMMAASWKVLRRRDELLDWGVFLALTWLIPYVGIAVYLGGTNLRSFWIK